MPMSLKYLFIITLFLLSASLVAQDNLVPNHSFESYENCPDMFSRVLHPWDTLEIVYLKDWLSPNYGSSDYYNACSPSDSTISVPQNIAGYIPSVKGNAYAGIYTLATYETFNNVSVPPPPSFPPSYIHPIFTPVKIGQTYGKQEKNIPEYYADAKGCIRLGIERGEPFGVLHAQGLGPARIKLLDRS